MKKFFIISFLLGIFLGLPLLGGLVGYQIARRKYRQHPWAANSVVQKRFQLWKDIETLAGAFASDHIPLTGVEKCYYTKSLDFSRITWAGRDMPVPFVNYAPVPGPLASGHINSMHFRYARELQTPKPPRTCRIFITGGSMAFGSGASSNETTVGGYLEKHLNRQSDQFGCRFEVITAATCAWASTHERILIENRLVHLQPDLVIALSGFNDAVAADTKSDVLWYRALQDDYFFTLTNSMVGINFKYPFPDKLSSAEKPISPAQSADRLAYNAKLAHHALQTAGADYCFALQPVMIISRKVRTPREIKMSTIYNRPSYVGHYKEYRARLGKLSLPGYHYFDLTGIFDNDKGTDIFIDGCHFGDRGHDLIAQALRDRLTPVLKARFKTIHKS
ncbi:MAG: hypothetical protein M3347_16550 [Armatimonadota bacterium]|nr:hypothetical protein [Armatimonadota bacterium]